MPDSRPLNELRGRLAQALRMAEPTASSPWVDPRPMARALQEVREAFGNAEGPPPHDEVLRALEAFRRQGSAQGLSPRQLKYVCHGVAVPLERGRWSLVAQQPMLEGFFKHVERKQGEALTFRRCYQGLLGSYFAMDRQETGSPTWQAWERLRGFLKQQLPVVTEGTRRAGHEPQWLNTLRQHENLLGEEGQRCCRYSNGLMRNDTGELRAVCETLGIQSTSWVWDEALLAYVRTVADEEDRGFKLHLGDVLELLNGRREWQLPERVAVTGTAITVRRYSKCKDRPEYPALRDTCLNHIGNPWLKRTHWDAWVKDEPARQMVDGWLKRQFIKDFFEALSEDRAADKRRLDYWLQWADRIEDIWFVLGARAREDRRPEIVSLRERIVGRSAQLTGSTAQNNAFIMRIGPLLVVEFSQKGNACFVFNCEHPPVDLNSTSHYIKALRGDVAVPRRLDRMLHVDRSALPWEMQFDSRLTSHIGMGGKGSMSVASTPENRVDRLEHRDRGLDRPNHSNSHSNAQAPLFESTKSRSSKIISSADAYVVLSRCGQLNIPWKDNRDNGGALWVFMPEEHQRTPRMKELLAYMTNVGFELKQGKGYWISGK